MPVVSNLNLNLKKKKAYNFLTKLNNTTNLGRRDLLKIISVFLFLSFIRRHTHRRRDCVDALIAKSFGGHLYTTETDPTKKRKRSDWAQPHPFTDGLPTSVHAGQKNSKKEKVEITHTK